MIKIILIFLFLFFKSFANANIKLQIIDNFKNIKNLKFEFVQKIGKKTESGDCIIDYSEKKILCKYNDVHDKVMVSNGNSLFINSKKMPKGVGSSQVGLKARQLYQYLDRAKMYFF